jgi:hypothetical protein
MNAELLALIKALDAVKEAKPEEDSRLKAIYDSRLQDVREKHPNLSKETLEIMGLARKRWLKAQKLPPTLPPKA